MSLSIEPKKGIRLTIGPYSAIKTWQGGGKFWEHDFQLTLRQGELKEFLPRATEERGSVLFQQVVDGNEVVSSSLPFSNLDQIPSQQIERLRRAIAELKAKTEDPNCDANKRKMIEAFRLPDPKKDAELYRYHGLGRNKRLIVLWGVEKEAGSAIAPLKALESMPSQSRGLAWTNWIWPLLFVLVAALGALFFLNSKSKPEPPSSLKAPSQPPSLMDAAPESEPPAQVIDLELKGEPTSVENMSIPEGVQVQTPGSSAPSNLKSNSFSILEEPSVPASQQVESTATGSPSQTPINLTNQEPESQPIEGNENIADQEETNTNNSSPTPIDKPVTKNGSLIPGGEETISPKPPTEDNDLNAQSSSTRSDTLSDNPEPNREPRSPNQGTKLANPQPDYLAANVAPIVTPSGASRFKISAQPEGETLNGQVTVNLIAIGQNNIGELVSGGFSITKWTVDGVVQRGPDGSELTSASLPVMLEKGVHRISVEGISASKEISSQADIDISLKVTEQSTVKVIPVP